MTKKDIQRPIQESEERVEKSSIEVKKISQNFSNTMKELNKVV